MAMARLNQALKLRQVASSLASEGPGEHITPTLLFGALAGLVRARPRLIAGLRSTASTGNIQKINHPKLKLWQALAHPRKLAPEEAKDLLTNLQQTQAWDIAIAAKHEHQKRLTNQAWNYQARLENEKTFIDNLKKATENQSNSKLIFWHHYDSLKYIPSSWKSILIELKHRGWVVIVSSSGLQHEEAKKLQEAGIVLSLRKNIGLCLGAYKDFCCLLRDHSNIRHNVETLILCNDSTLPIGGKIPFCNHIERIDQIIDRKSPELIGLTDSVQNRRYHVQSYFLAVNSPLVKTPDWAKFWNQLKLEGDKDKLIESGEIGLSQWLLSRGIKISAIYPLTSILLNSKKARKEIKQLDLRQPEEINMTLMCWRGLLEEGFPLIKKQLLLSPPHFLKRPAPMTELSVHLNDDDTELIQDLDPLVKSRFHQL